MGEAASYRFSSKTALGLALAMAGASVAVWAFGAWERLTDRSDGAIPVCEEAIRSTLKSPDSYRRIWVDYTPRGALSQQELAEYHAKQDCSIAQLADAGGCDSIGATATKLYGRQVELDLMGITRPTRKQLASAQAVADKKDHDAYMAWPAEHRRSGFVLLQYDATNSFGASTRSFGICRFGPIGASKRFDQEDIFAVGAISDADAQMAKGLSERYNSEGQ